MKPAVLLSVIILEIAVAVTLSSRTDRGHLQNTDFVNFYAAGSIVRQGHGAELYRRDTQDAALQAILGHGSAQYFLHPPFEALVFALLSYLTIEHAFVVWTMVNVGLLGLLPIVLMSSVPLIAQKPYLGLLGFAFLPALTALTLGQDSILLLLVLSLAYVLLHSKRESTAGLVLALTAIKFQYLLLLIPLLLFWRKLRVVAGLAVGSVFLLCVSALIVRARGILEYLNFLRSFDAHAGFGGLNLTLMVNWRGFLAGAGATAHATAYQMAGAVLLLGLGFACTQFRQSAGKENLMFALLVTITLAASPYAHFPDMTFLFLPILLAADYVFSSEGTGVAKFISICCLLLIALPWLLVGVGGHYWWNSRIYLVFPAILLFLVAMARALFREQDREAAAVAQKTEAA